MPLPIKYGSKGFGPVTRLEVPPSALFSRDLSGFPAGYLPSRVSCLLNLPGHVRAALVLLLRARALVAVLRCTCSTSSSLLLRLLRNLFAQGRAWASSTSCTSTSWTSMRLWGLFGVLFFASHCTFDLHTSKAAEKSESGGSGSLASLQAWCHPLGRDRTGAHQKGDCSPPFKGQRFSTSHQPRDGAKSRVVSMEVLVRQAEPQIARMVPPMPQALDYRRAPLHQRGGELPGQGQLGALPSWSEPWTTRWIDPQGTQTKCQSATEERQGEEREKGSTDLTLRPICHTMAYNRDFDPEGIEAHTSPPAAQQGASVLKLCGQCRSRASWSSAEALPGSCGCPARNQGGSAEGRGPQFQADRHRAHQGVQAGWGDCPTASRAQGDARASSGCMGEAPQGGTAILGESGAGLCHPAEDLPRTHVQSPDRARSGKGRDPKAQLSSRQGDQGGRDHRSHSTRRCAWQGRGSSHVGGTSSRSTTSLLPNGQAGDPRRGQRRGGNGQFRGRGDQAQETSKIPRTFWRQPSWWWLYCASCIVNFGDGLQCPRNYIRAPERYGPGGGAFAEAYAASVERCAACIQQPLGSLHEFWYATHSIRYEDNFMDTFNALHNATALHGENILFDDPPPMNCSYKGSDSLTSCLVRERGKGTAKTVHFDALIEAVPDEVDVKTPALRMPNSHSNFDGDEISFMAAVHHHLNAQDINIMTEHGIARQEEDPDQQLDDDEEHSPSFETEMPFSPDSLNDLQLPWHSVAIYDTRANSARGRVPFQPYEAFFGHVRRLIGFMHHDVARIVQIAPSPEDLMRIAVTPLLVLRHDDFDDGDHRNAVLVDIEFHGPSFDSPVITDRFVAKIPSPIHRQKFLEWIRVDRYCSGSKNRCLVWHQGSLVSLRSPAPMHLSHGNYIRVAIPPFQFEEVPTRLAVRCGQAGLTPRQTRKRFQQRGEDTDSLYSEIDAAQSHEVSSLVQLHSSRPAFVSLRSDGDAAAPRFTCVAPGAFRERPADHPEAPVASWHAALLEAFSQSACVEHEDEGPVTYLETWYVHGIAAYATEHSRTMRLTQEQHWWQEDITDLWNDKVDRTLPLHFLWVRPTPESTVTRARIGHLILWQEPRIDLVPVLLTIEFLHETTRRIAFAAALLPTPVAALQVRDLLRLARLCIERRCTLSHDDDEWGPFEARPLRPGMGLVFSAHPLPRELHIMDDHVVASQLVQPTVDEIPLEEQIAQPPITGESPFTRRLHGIWNERAVIGPAQIERLLTVRTWYLEGRYIPFHDECRSVVLGNDFWLWEGAIIHRWRDFVLDGVEVDFVIVTPTPPSANEIDEVHIIVYQNIAAFEHPSLITSFDNGVLRGIPYTSAALLPSAVTKTDILRCMGKDRVCPPERPDTACSCWYGDYEIRDGERFANRHGYSFNLYIQRSLPDNFWEDDMSIIEEEIDATDLLQRSTHKQTKQNIDFEPVAKAFDWLDSHLFLPCFDLPHLHDTHPAWPWTTTWWDYETPCTEIHIYTDGSFGSNNAAAAIAAFVRTEEGWCFAGAMSSKLQMAHNAYGAELLGITVAAKVAYDILKIHSALFDWAPPVTLCYDALTAGHQASGAWRCAAQPLIGRALRGIILLVETRFQTSMNYVHIPGHSGEPGNELVDTLASEAREGQKVAPFDDWICSITKNEFVDALDWMWALFAREYAGLWKGNVLHHPGPATMPTNSLLPVHELQQRSEEDKMQVAEISLRMATCNVLSLKGSVEDNTSMAGLSRQRALLSQFAEEKIMIFGLQETRLRKLHSGHDEDYFLFKAAATSQGHFGIIAGLAKKIPYGSVWCSRIQRRRPVFFKKEHFKILAFDPRFLILKIDTPYLRAVLIVGHAPHTGNDMGIIESWWEQLHAAVPQAYAKWPLILLCDANAAVGFETSQHIGEHQASKQDEKAAAFESFIARNELWIPSTFAEYHQGDGMTWEHTSGKKKRLDYVCIPMAWRAQSCTSWISDAIDPTLVRNDHAAACAEIKFLAAYPLMTATKQQNHKLVIEDTEVDWRGLETSFPATLDVHSHLHHLQGCLVKHLQPMQRRRHVARPVKETMSASTWALVCEKRTWRRTLAEYNKIQRTTILEYVFGRWKKGRTQANAEVNKLLVMQDKLIAGALWHFRRLGRSVTRSMRSDDRNFFAGLLQDGAEFLAPTQVKQLWAVIRRSIPKFQTRRCGYDPHVLGFLDHSCLDYFRQLELGVDETSDDLVLQCLTHQQAEQDGAPQQVSLQSLPTRFEFEAALRDTCMDRATGFDCVPSAIYHKNAAFLADYFYQVLIKTFLWGAEPVQNKGGILKMIPKKPGALEPQSFRGILLLPTLAKRVHALVRGRLMKQVALKRDPGQMGGYPGQQVAFGAQTIRTLASVFSAQGWSSAVLYVDLSTAFHHLVRELVTGATSETAFQEVLRALHQSGTPLDASIHGSALIGLLAEHGIDPLLLRLLRDIHAHTWFVLAGNSQQMIWTKRGTRPGSPLADAIFHVLMASIAGDLRGWLSQQEDFVRLMANLQLQPVLVIWSDDLAIPIAATTATSLLPRLAELAAEVTRQFKRRGFTVNFTPGKTSAVVSFVGREAPELRRKHLLGSNPGINVEVDDEQTSWLSFTNAYKHLGAQFAASHSCEPELRQRIGMSKATFSKLSRMVLSNRHFPVHIRIQFLQSLVFSKLFYGLGSWDTPSGRQMQRLRTAYHGMLRKTLRLEADEQVTNQQLLARARVVDVRARIAIDRLAYARRVFQAGPAELQQIVHIEQQCCASSWLSALRADLDWLDALVPGVLPARPEGDLTDMIDFWQRDAIPWKGLLKRGLKRHRLQEEIMMEVHTAHHCSLSILRAGGATFSPDEVQVFGGDRTEVAHFCHCGRAFTSPQGLALHRRVRHGEHAPEFQFVNGATCPACLKFLWTSNRLAMHLAYAPRLGGVNVCFAKLSKAGFVGPHLAQLAPAGFGPAIRMDSIQAEGPLPSFRAQHEIALEKALRELSEVEQELHTYHRPEDEIVLGLQIGDTLTLGTKAWIQKFCDNQHDQKPDLIDWWLNVLHTAGEEFSDWAAMIFQEWGTHLLPELVADAMDGEVEYVLDELYAEAVNLLPREALLARKRQLHQLRHRFEEEAMAPEVPHRAVKKGTANVKERSNTRQQVPSTFFDQPQWHASFRAIQWRDLPQDAKIPYLVQPNGRPCFIIAHLFSGRRRKEDFHWWLQHYAIEYDIDLCILSLDTAISPSAGDLHRAAASWRQLERCYRAGIIAGSLLGTPCEFSEARYTPAPPDCERRWPRPLRSSDHLFGLPGLSIRELLQTQLGTGFALQGLEVLCHHLVNGGLVVSEHPAAPADLARPTVWRAGLTELLLRHPDVRLQTICQYEWGAPSVKPTGLLSLRVPGLIGALRTAVIPHVKKPQLAAIGCNEAGAFRTAMLKEYPPKLCQGLAWAFVKHLRAALRGGRTRAVNRGNEAAGPLMEVGEMYGWVAEVAEVGKTIRSDASILPDHQPRPYNA